MTKALTYSSFAVASLLIILGFVTAKTYSQLAAAAIFYPALIFIAFKIFPHKGWRMPKITTQAPLKLNHGMGSQTSRPKNEPVFVADIDRRAFIKLIGATGISVFIFSMLSRIVESNIFGKAISSGINQGSGGQIGPATASPTDGYKISEIDEGSVTYYGFTNHDGSWLIMREEADGGSFRYAKGSSNFPDSWVNRQNLKYDYFYNLP